MTLHLKSNQKNACTSLNIAFTAYECIADLCDMTPCRQVRDLHFDSWPCVQGRSSKMPASRFTIAFTAYKCIVDLCDMTPCGQVRYRTFDPCPCLQGRIRTMPAPLLILHLQLTNVSTYDLAIKVKPEQCPHLA